MSTPVSPTAGLEDVKSLYGADRAPGLDTDAFLKVFDQGIGTLSARPNFDGNVGAVDRLTGAYEGDVGAAKAEMIAGAQTEAENSSEAQAANLEERFQTLYFELTHYQIAWKIAQNVQRDVTQVLRGS